MFSFWGRRSEASNEDGDDERTPMLDRERPAYFDQDHDEYEDEEPILPIFSAAHLDKLPLYDITHAIRQLIVKRCETMLTWDQLRSPQISQFLVKPVQNQIKQDHMTRATICALVANCLQFRKESQTQPQMIGVLATRALMSELLALRLLKEFNTRELIDALSYDFDPLQGLPETTTPAVRDLKSHGLQARAARVSTIEIAIRAQAKRFLAHPLVVQHLQAIWAGTVVFQNTADDLHRKPSEYGTMDHSKSPRKAVQLYNPHDASLFKLSRLRVPLYRQVFGTFSFAIMLGLFLAVLIDRSVQVTSLELVFWLWSSGYMLDEVVGFSEQGFGLYIMSFWNAFDLGFLMLFLVYYCLRLYGLFVAEGKEEIAGMAYDVLGSTAVLLFPRLFSVLDHYRYFSQLLIAFRMMAQDLVAILILIIISCSGFFVAFTFSFSNGKVDAKAVAYALFQIVMGFSPAAWEKWPVYNFLGKIILAVFLVMCHFLIVTILITVLTNSFMAIVQNANEEHQFVFAVNTISSVKSDMLFTYIAPSNIIGWALSPLRFVIRFRKFVMLNRTIIKITHFPILFLIYAYERLILSGMTYSPTDLIERRGRPKTFAILLGSPGRKLREPSVASFKKDLALDEVFRKPFKGNTMRTTPRDISLATPKSTNVVDNWMQEAENEGGASPPVEQPRSVLERLERRRPYIKRSATGLRLARSRLFSTASRSVASDPDILSIRQRKVQRIIEEGALNQAVDADADADGDDEINDESDQQTQGIGESIASSIGKREANESEEEDFATPRPGRSPLIRMSSAAEARLRAHQPSHGAGLPRWKPSGHRQRQQSRGGHARNTSTTTVLFAPPTQGQPSAGSKKQPKETKRGAATPVPSRPIPVRERTLPLPKLRHRSSYTEALDLASEIGDNRAIDAGGISGMPASLSDQILREHELARRMREEKKRSEEEEKGMVNRILLTRMHVLEERFGEVLKEVKGLGEKGDKEKERMMKRRVDVKRRKEKDSPKKKEREITSDDEVAKDSSR
ncbi:hypothetical protein K470DRAFT_256655 [Piedraia hortae CBS 480.64]|uniref:Ion transport domain-containing protein n=1 Tax=Piedraia hortae CBS 480.64 TaxID=1314780 RepID=A0A6A7C2W8_9PEZI|nr:hypothetical protein K470DRAFT_256655 [Piedraia hortae CBS 480.64]